MVVTDDVMTIPPLLPLPLLLPLRLRVVTANVVCRAIAGPGDEESKVGVRDAASRDADASFVRSWMDNALEDTRLALEAERDKTGEAVAATGLFFPASGRISSFSA